MTTAAPTNEGVAGARASFKFEGGPEVAATTRAQLGNLRPRLDQAIAEDVALLLSELVTNAYRHSGEPDAPIGVDVEVAHDRVRCEVVDQGKGYSAQPIP